MTAFSPPTPTAASPAQALQTDLVLDDFEIGMVMEYRRLRSTRKYAILEVRFENGKARRGVWLPETKTT